MAFGSRDEAFPLFGGCCALLLMVIEASATLVSLCHTGFQGFAAFSFNLSLFPRRRFLVMDELLSVGKFYLGTVVELLGGCSLWLVRG